MKLPAFALFERSLRVETRSLLVCLARVGLLMLILLLLLSVQSSARAGWYGAPGLAFFDRMVVGNMVFISLAGFSYFASAITEEKEEMMLGLLRMTDLNPIAILLGKSTSRLVGAFLLLVVQVPFVLLAVTLGGVGLVQIAAAYSTMMAYLFMMCNVALLCSVVFRNTASAAAVTGLLKSVFLLGPFMAAGLLDSVAFWYHVDLQRGGWHFISEVIALWRRTNPITTLYGILQTGFPGPVVGFQVASNLVFGVLSFLLSWLVFDWCTRTEKDPAPTRRWIFTRKGRNGRLPRYVAGAYAITWKDFAFITGGKFGLLLKFAVMGLIIGLCTLAQYESDTKLTWEFEGWALFWVSLLSTAIWLAVEASRIFKDEVRWKTLSSLMTLPMSVQEIAYRKVIGAFAGTLPLLAGFFLGLLILSDKLGDILGDIAHEPWQLGLMAVVFLQFVLFLHLTAFLSLVIKRGALPLAMAIQGAGVMVYILFSVALFAAFSGGPGGAFFLAGFVSVVLTIPLHIAIKYRLEHLATQE